MLREVQAGAVRAARYGWALSLCLVYGCAGEPQTGAADGSRVDKIAACSTERDLAGYEHTIEHTKFAFGGKPSKEVQGDLTRWTGPLGAFAIFSDKSVIASPNGGVTAAPFAGSVADHAALVVSYFEQAGLPACQVSGSQTSGGSDGPTELLARAIDGIPIFGSVAWARFNGDGTTGSETVYWPPLPKAEIQAALAFRAALQDPEGLAAYRAKLPADATAPGAVVIRHTGAALGKSFAVHVVFAVPPTPPYDWRTERYFDREGVELTEF